MRCYSRKEGENERGEQRFELLALALYQSL